MAAAGRKRGVPERLVRIVAHLVRRVRRHEGRIETLDIIVGIFGANLAFAVEHQIPAFIGAFMLAQMAVKAFRLTGLEAGQAEDVEPVRKDRKSTRLNSSN